ncbi:ATP-binding protein [Salinarimonas sp.]|uniref:hybrid sensor histidine kinase/response regulator n=1 Tax=Salinarimonas sp. TaxID=2766526 RepID=UPI00391B1A99
MQPKASISAKLGRLVLVCVGVALAIGSTASLVLEAERYGNEKRDRLVAVAEAFAAASAKGVAARDGAAIFEATRAIRAMGEVTSIVVQDAAGAVLEETGDGIRLDNVLELRPDHPVAVRDIVRARMVEVIVPVVESGAIVGRLTLVAHTGDLLPRLLQILATGLLLAAAVAALGLAVAHYLQRAITRPLLSLAATMDRVRAAHDYSEACAVESDDEVGRLATGFNAMMSEIRRRDARLAEHRERLESEVEDRTRDLAAAKRAAEAANAAKSDFLATMSHEIRTPMNGMMVMAELLAAGDLPERQRRYAEVIARSGQSLIAIIDDILDLAKVEAGKLELERIRVDAAEIVETVVTLFGERARAKGLDLAAIVEGTPPAFLGDPVRLTQVVSNLVNNALKFTERGHVLVRVAMQGDRLRIAVVDTGIGISPEKQAAIFSAFSQEDAATTRRFGGTGLGLSIAKRLVEAMEGTIGLASVPGEGTTFTVEVPLPLLERRPASPLLPPERAGERVHLAIAGAATRAALESGLREAGFAPVALSPEALAHARLDGHLVVEAEALGTTRPPGARRVLAIAPIGDAAGERALAQGLADALLRRPLPPSEWREALARLVDGAPFARASAGGEETGLASYAGARVLVADDSAVNREVACAALARFGILAQTVETGRAALEAVLAERFDLVLMDGSMPDMDGYEATRAIRDHEARRGGPRTTIVALTAHVVGPAAEAWRACGMDGSLTKPFTLPKLGEVLARVLGGRGIDAPAPAPGLAGEADAIPLLDEDTLAQIADMAALSGSGLLARIVGLFLRHAPDSLARIEAAIGEAEPEAIASAAHALKSMSLNIGAARLAASLARIEAAAREGGTVPDDTILRALDACLADTLTALRARFPDGEEAVAEAKAG